MPRSNYVLPICIDCNKEIHNYWVKDQKRCRDCYIEYKRAWNRRHYHEQKEKARKKAEASE